jgi:chromosome segregation ATPase
MEETRLKKVVEGYHYTYDDQKKYAQEKDVTELSQKLVAINQIENEQKAKETEVKSIESKIEEKTRLINTYEQNEIRYEQEIKDMEEKIEKLKVQIIESKESRKVQSVITTKLGKELTQAKEAYAAIEVPDKIEIEEELAEVSEWNKTVAHVAKYTADLKSLQAQEKVYRDLTEELKDIDKAKKKKLEEAEIPVEGLSFDENTLIYEDKPLVKDVVNDAKIAEVILTLLLRTNKNQQEKTGEDKLSIFRLNGGDLTDSTFNAIMAIVQKEDGEVFVEIPDDDQEEMAIKFIEHA